LRLNQFEEVIVKRILTPVFVAAVLVGAVSASAQSGPFLVNERNASTIWTWEPAGGTTAVYHTTQANDADLPGGSTYGWVAEHFNDYFARFVPGSGSGWDQQYSTGYAYPKHITVYNGEVIVMSRNDATIWRYDENGGTIGSVPTGNVTGQGMATDGTDIYVSFWNGSNSFFERYDSSFTMQETIANPSGMGNNNNVVDIVYDTDSGNFFGLATADEGGTGTQTNTVIEFAMGGAVVATYTLPFLADGIGQYNQPVPVELMSISVD
jgi:hypothetical protein